MESETFVILFLLALVLAPLWFFALQSAEAQQEVALSQTEGVIRPTARFLPTPVAVNELVAGVITWVAAYVLVGLIFYTHRLVRRVGQSEESVAADGGAARSLPSYLLTDDRRLVDYWPAQATTPGFVGIVVTSGTAVVFAVLFAFEALTLARTQYLGVYGGILFLSLGLLVAVYATWFLPSVHVAQRLGHEEIRAESSEERPEEGSEETTEADRRSNR